MGARPAQSRWATGGRADTAAGLGELCRRRRTADAPWAHHGGARTLVRRDAAPRRRLSGGGDAGLAAAGPTRARLAGARAHLGEPESQRSEPVDGALLCLCGDARRAVDL